MNNNLFIWNLFPYWASIPRITCTLQHLKKYKRNTSNATRKRCQCNHLSTVTSRLGSRKWLNMKSLRVQIIYRNHPLILSFSRVFLHFDPIGDPIVCEIIVLQSPPAVIGSFFKLLPSLFDRWRCNDIALFEKKMPLNVVLKLRSVFNVMLSDNCYIIYIL